MGSVPFFRGGFTLIEMLIVVSIMMILVVAAATTMQPATESRRIRETARAVHVYLGSARNRAMETRRPCGVVFRQFGTISCAMNADQCEVPPCYCGDMQNSMAQVQLTNLTSTRAWINAAFTPSGSFTPTLVSVGDLIQFNCQGPTYTITARDVNGVTAWCDVSQGQVVPWPTAAPFPIVPYRIFRSPMKGMATPLQLPASAVVDLQWSGIGNGGTFGASPGDVTVLFSPNGSVDRVYVGANVYYPTEPIFLLVGKRERVGNPGVATPASDNEPDWANFQDLNNMWVVINPQTGVVTTDYLGSTTGSTPTSVNEARQLAREARGMGGR